MAKMMETCGFVNVLKPTGMTSADVVFKVKKILKTKKVGHLGTLDMPASGVLPIAVGKATKFFDYFLNKDKEYVAVVDFGVKTDTLDSFGNLIQTQDTKVTKEQIEQVLPLFKGEIEQIPPKYSALKINGKRASDLARENIEFEIKPRKIHIFDIQILSDEGDNRFRFLVHCSAGTYIRTLFSDIAEKLETVATTPVIIRTKSGKFDIEHTVTLDELEKTQCVETVNKVFDDYKIITINESVASKLLNGVKTKTDLNIVGEFLIEFEGRLVGLFVIEDGYFKRIVYLY